MARIVVKVARVVGSGKVYAFFREVIVNVENATTRENFLKVIVLEGLEARAA